MTSTSSARAIYDSLRPIIIPPRSQECRLCTEARALLRNLCPIHGGKMVLGAVDKKCLARNVRFGPTRYGFWPTPISFISISFIHSPGLASTYGPTEGKTRCGGS
jgi:hypothetical protein